MTVQDLGNNITLNNQILPATYTADQTGVGVDTSGYAYAVVIVTAGLAATANPVTFTLQDSLVLGSGYEACNKLGTTDDAVIVAITTGNDNDVYTAAVDLNHTRDFIRVISVETGDSGNSDYSVNIILMPYYTGNADVPTISV